MKKLLLLVIFYLGAYSLLIAQELPSNNLDGVLIADGQELTIMYRLSENQKNIETYLYIPEQLLFAHRASETIIRNDSIIIKLPTLGAEYIGKIDYMNGVVRGKHLQAGMEFELDLHFTTDDESNQFKRPQEPTEPLGYTSQEHLIRDNKKNVAISGTLTLPNKIDKFPLVILITGSGPQDRNHTIAGHKPFFVISDFLTKNGIAVFRYDERGVGKSTGSFAEATTEDFTYDVLNIIRYFKVHKNIDSDNIGLVGHSEGGLVAMKAAAKSRRDIAFIISIAGPAVKSTDLLQQQLEDILINEGQSDEFIELSKKYQAKLFEIAVNTDDMTEFRKEYVNFKDDFKKKLSDEQIQKFGFSNQNTNATVMQMASPWMKYFLEINPEKYLNRLRCPVLALFGGKDLQVSAKTNQKKIEEILSSKRNQEFETHTFNELNHLFQTAETGAIREYLLIEETFALEALNKIKEFVYKQAGMDLR